MLCMAIPSGIAPHCVVSLLRHVHNIAGVHKIYFCVCAEYKLPSPDEKSSYGIL